MMDEKSLASLYMEVVPKAMREFRKEMRNSRCASLTVPQYRILAQLDYEKANNRELAEQLGVSVAAMSRMVDWLSNHGLVERKENPGDRRMVKVQLTRKGRNHFAKFRKEARARLQKRLSTLDGEAKKNLNSGLAALALAVNHMGQII
jgi:DNA-binding MarR family transcriptional regulator